MSPRDNQRAFTLIEITVALLILLIGLLGIAQLFIFSTYSNRFAQNTTIAIKAAENVLEQLRSINTWNPSDANSKPIRVGGTVLLPADGGPTAESLPVSSSSGGPDQAHIAGVYFEPEIDGSGKILFYKMQLCRPSDTANWPKRQFEARWQVIGYNNAGTVNPGTAFSLTNAYQNSSNIPDFASLLSSPTPPKPGVSPTEQTSVWVIVRVGPIANDVRQSKKVQIATLLVNPS